jgi:hypothetical protein
LRKIQQIQCIGVICGWCGRSAAGPARQILPPSLPFGRRFLPDDIW